MLENQGSQVFSNVKMRTEKKRSEFRSQLTMSKLQVNVSMHKSLANRLILATNLKFLISVPYVDNVVSPLKGFFQLFSTFLEKINSQKTRCQEEEED